MSALVERCASATPEETSRILDESCDGEPGLRSEVEDLLAVMNPMGSFLDEGSPGEALRGSGPAPDGEMLSTERIGPYRVHSVLGHGGMGTVYSAVQEGTRRAVALKVLAPGMVSDDLIARFSREAQLLGRLAHPGIVQVFEAGEDSSRMGPPTRYFAMELIDGESLTEHAQSHGLSFDERLALIADTCEAIAHAHDRGVIHRDLKPSNVLVDQTGQVKVLDFGIARPGDLTHTSATRHTRTGQLVGTLSYMSPEQASGKLDEVDERTDIYALGTLAFELLTGRTPRDLDGLGLPQALHTVLNTEARSVGTLDHNLRGDVDAIVNKALEREPARRYASASEMAADIRRYLAHEPIVARPPTLSHRARQFLRRHPAKVFAAAATILVLSLGLVVVGKVAQRETLLRHAALRGEYRAALTAATASLKANDTARARDALVLADESLRSWEWHHLFSQLDESVSRQQFSPACLLDSALGGIECPAAGYRLDDLLLFESRAARSFDTDIDVSKASVGGGGVLVASRDEWAVLDQESGTWRALPQGWRFVPDPTRKFLAGVRSDRSQASVLRAVDLSVVGTLDFPSIAHAAASPGAEVVAILTDESRAVFLWWPRGDAAPMPLDCSVPEKPVGLQFGFSPTEDWGLRSCSNGSLRAFSTVDGSPLPFNTESFGWEVRRIQFGPLGKRILLAADARLFLLDAADGRVIRMLGTSDWPSTHAFSADGELLVYTDNRRALHVVSTEHGDGRVRLQGAKDSRRGLAFSADSSRIASLSRTGELRTWLASGKNGRVLRGHESYVYGLSFSPDGHRLASGAWDGTTRLWDVPTGEPLATLLAPGDGVGGRVAYSPKQDFLVSNHGVFLNTYHPLTGELLASLRPAGGSGRHGIDSLVWHPDGVRFVASEGATGELVRGRVEPDGSLTLTPPETVGVRIVALDQAGEVLALGMNDGHVETRDFATGELIHRYEDPHASAVTCLAFSKDGRRLASGSNDKSVVIWSVAESARLQEIAQDGGIVYDVAFHPTADRLAVAHGDGTIRIVDPTTGGQLALLDGHESYVYVLAFSPDGDILASGSGDGTVRLWETQPLGNRIRAAETRRERLKALTPLVVETLSKSDRPGQAAAEIRGNVTLSPSEKQAALDLILESCLGRSERIRPL